MSLQRLQKLISDEYTCKKVIGEGASGRVVLALDNKTGERVAIKEIHFDNSSYYQVKKIVREIAILKFIQTENHP